MAKNSEISDLFYWKGMISGDHYAFSVLFKSYFNNLYNFGKLYTFETEIISDTIQDLFVDFWDKRNRLNKNVTVKAYIYGAFKKKLYKKLKKRSVFDFKKVDNNDIGSFPSTEESIISNDLMEQKKTKVQGLISKLSPKQREVIYLKFYKGFSISEISEALNINYQSVKNHIYRSTQTIKKEIDLHK